MRSSHRSKSARYVAAVLAVAGATIFLILIRGRINPTTVALAFLLMILFVAMIWGSKPALLAAVLGMLSFNFFFLPPYHTFTIADPQNRIALVAFAAALAVGQLSAHVNDRPRNLDQPIFIFNTYKIAQQKYTCMQRMPCLICVSLGDGVSDLMRYFWGHSMVLEVVGAFIESCRGRNFEIP